VGGREQEGGREEEEEEEEGRDAFSASDRTLDANESLTSSPLGSEADSRGNSLMSPHDG